MRGVFTDPGSLQRPRPTVMAAGFSRKGRDFAAQAADVLFTLVSEIEQIPGMVQNVRDYASKYDRNIGLYTQAQIVCRPTFKEAMDYYHYFAEEMADMEAVEYHRGKSSTSKGSDTAYSERPSQNKYSRMTGKKFLGAYPSIYPLIGSPDEIVAEMKQMHEAGLSGLAIVFLNYLDEMPYFNAEVLPRLERAGLRVPLKRA